ncbi:MAG: hypothetical protein H0V17_05715, partial [Deltaproteobacteria bacterium]|nr:hypothetical protein [Deltaproteobacteria bacterium]
CTGTPLSEIVLRNQAGTWELSGTWIGAQKTVKELPNTTFKVGAVGTSPDGKVASVAIGGSGTIGGYKIELAGKLEALDCPIN